MTVTVPGVERMVPIAPVDPPTQRGVGEALAQVLQSASPEAARVTQASDSGILTVQTVEGREFAFLPLGVRAGTPPPPRAPPPEPGFEPGAGPVETEAGHGALRRAQVLGLPLDPFFGTATVVTPQGTQVELMGAPPDLAGFLALLRPLGVTGLTIERGHFVVQTIDPSLSGIVRLDFELLRGAGRPGPEARPDGTGQVIYPGGRVQGAVPVFADLVGFLQLLQAEAPPFHPGRPDVRGFHAQADGTVQAIIDGQPLRFRPDFVVTSSPGTSKRILTEGSGMVFQTGDGRRQRFTIVP